MTTSIEDKKAQVSKLLAEIEAERKVIIRNLELSVLRAISELNEHAPYGLKYTFRKGQCNVI
jgi:hypothetical protein